MRAAFNRMTRTVSPWIFLAGTEALAQVSLKMAADATGTSEGPLQTTMALLKQPWFVLSIACDIAGLVAWMAVLRRHDISFAVPVSALSYFAILGTASIALHEPVAWQQCAGLLCIGIGILWIARDD